MLSSISIIIQRPVVIYFVLSAATCKYEAGECKCAINYPLGGVLITYCIYLISTSLPTTCVVRFGAFCWLSYVFGSYTMICGQRRNISTCSCNWTCQVTESYICVSIWQKKCRTFDNQKASGAAVWPHEGAACRIGYSICRALRFGGRGWGGVAWWSTVAHRGRGGGIAVAPDSGLASAFGGRGVRRWGDGDTASATDRGWGWMRTTRSHHEEELGGW
jgi:hypothetical protein